jgi:arginine decarboxylase
MSSLSQTPLINALQSVAARSHAAFYTPGHKRGQGAAKSLANLIGKTALQADLPELPDLDNLFAPQGVIQTAQALAANTFGAEQTWFLVNGSTCGIEAAILATCQPGDRLILPRNAHQSAIAALILSGAIPIFVEPEYDAEWGIAHSITPASVTEALTQHSDARAILMVSPTYYGVCGDVEAIAAIAHTHNIPLIVDEAHGAHFAFHPELPSAALASGADLVIQSTHKMLSALTQAAMMHVQGVRIVPARVAKALQLVQSTSPSYLLLASLDAARQQMATQGQELLSQTIELADRARMQLSQIPGLAVLSLDRAGTPGCVAIDRTRLTVDVTGLGLTGFEADEILHQQMGVTAELPSLRQLTFIFSIGNTSADVDCLLQGFDTLSKRFAQPSQARLNSPELPLPIPPAPLSPRDAFFAASDTILMTEAIDRICAELVCPYPPGIPVLLPGEQITAEAIHYLQQVVAMGGIITGCADETLQTISVVRSA